MHQHARTMTFRGTHDHSLIEDWMQHVPGFDSDVLALKDKLGYALSYVVVPDTPRDSAAPDDGALSVCQGGELACPCSAAL